MDSRDKLAANYLRKERDGKYKRADFQTKTKITSG